MRKLWCVRVCWNKTENREHFMKWELDRLEAKEITDKEYKEEVEK